MRFIKATTAGVSATAGAIGVASAQGVPPWYVYLAAVATGVLAFVATYAAPANKP